jgi:hypothetical protein
MLTAAQRRYPLAEEQQGSAYFPLAGARFAIPGDRPDLMLVELKTDQGPLRFSMSKMTALGFARSIAEEAEKLSPAQSTP